MRTSTNSTVMKAQNQRLVLDLLRTGPRSRAEMAHATGLTRASLSLIADELLAEGLIRENGTTSSGAGRNAILLEIVPNARYAIGVNISRSDVRIGLISLGGDLLQAHSLHKTPSEPQSTLNEVARIVKLIATQIPDPKLLGVGICAPGPLDHKTGRMLNAPNFAPWHGVEVCSILHAHTGLPTLLENVSNAYALEEQYFGAAKGLSNFIRLQVDEGIGSGIVVADQLYRGRSGIGSELGHTTIQYNGKQCACGNRGCLEQYASLPTLLENSPYPNWAALINGYRQGEAIAQALLLSEVEYLCAALINAFNLFDLERIIIGGELAQTPELLHALAHEVADRAITRDRLTLPAVAAASSGIAERAAAMPVLHAFYH